MLLTDHTPPPRLRRALRPAAPLLAIAIATAVGGGLSTLAGTAVAVQFVAQPHTGTGITAAVAWCLGAVLLGLSAWAAHTGEARFSTALRRSLATHLTRLPASTLTRIGGDRLRRAVSDDIAALHHAVAHAPAEIATLLVVPAVSVILLVSIAGPSALVILIPGLLAACYFLVVVPRIAARTGAQQAALLNDIESAVDDYARGIRVRRIFAAQEGATAEYREATQRFTRGIVSWVARVATPGAIAVACLQAGLTYAVAYLIGHDREPAVLAAMMLFGLAVVTPALRLGHGIDYLRAGRAAAERIGELLAETALSDLSPAGAADHTAQEPGVAIAGLTVQLDGRPVLQQLSHTFPIGTVTAVTGVSGTGKSTLLRTIAGWESADEGTVRLPAARAATPALLIPQGGDVLDASVRENLTLDGHPRNDTDLRAALHRAGIDVNLDAAASRLSGGERQRVNLARGFLTPAPVILLDEPTSALDRATAGRVFNSFRELARAERRTIIIVTHDPSLAAIADARLDLGVPWSPVGTASRTATRTATQATPFQSSPDVQEIR